MRSRTGRPRATFNEGAMVDGRGAAARRRMAAADAVMFPSADGIRAQKSIYHTIDDEFRHAPAKMTIYSWPITSSSLRVVKKRG